MAQTLVERVRAMKIWLLLIHLSSGYDWIAGAYATKAECESWISGPAYRCERDIV